MNCLACKKRVPDPDSHVSICVWCGAVAVVEGGKQREPTAAELDRVQRTTEYRMALDVVRDFDLPLVE